jgi:hypothetical protein
MNDLVINIKKHIGSRPIPKYNYTKFIQLYSGEIFMLTGVLVGAIFSVLLIAFGLYRLYQYYIFHHLIDSQSAWPETAGTVVAGYTGYTPGIRGGKNYYAVIEYHYLVQGHKYIGKLKKNTVWGEGQAKRLLAKYPPESVIEVHYNPAQPDVHVSALDKSKTYLVVSLVVFLFGFLGVISAFVAK